MDPFGNAPSASAVIITLVIAALFALVIPRLWRRRQTPNSNGSSNAERSRLPGASVGTRIVILYATQKGTCRALSHKLFSLLVREVTSLPSPSVVDAADVVSIEELPQKGDLFILIASTYSGGRSPPSANTFEFLLRDAAQDHRVSRELLKSLKFMIFGVGDTVYGEDFCRFPKGAAEWVASLGAEVIAAPTYAAERKVRQLFEVFSKNVLRMVLRSVAGVTATTAQRVAGMNEGPASCSDDEAALPSDDDNEDHGLQDLEDVVAATKDTNELLYPRLAKNLTKQGYSLIGTHSAVKLCRWTKSMLRGRGGCYKHTFYNISSMNCMEMTPSLACANKCVFCWRHHTNPVTKSFSWKMDSPEFLVEQALEKHRRTIAQFKGVPGVTPEALKDAMNIRHCALSLVGEPIIYHPEILSRWTTGSVDCSSPRCSMDSRRSSELATKLQCCGEALRISSTRRRVRRHRSRLSRTHRQSRFPRTHHQNLHCLCNGWRFRGMSTRNTSVTR